MKSRTKRPRRSAYSGIYYGEDGVPVMEIKAPRRTSNSIVGWAVAGAFLVGAAVVAAIQAALLPKSAVASEPQAPDPIAPDEVNDASPSPEDDSFDGFAHPAHDIPYEQVDFSGGSIDG